MSEHKSGLQKKVSSIFGDPPNHTNSNKNQPPTLGSKNISRKADMNMSQNNKNTRNYNFDQTQWWQGAINKLFTPKTGVSPLRHIATIILIPILLIILGILLSKNSKSTEVNAAPPTATDIIVTDEIDWRKPQAYQAGTRDPMQFSAKKTTKDETGGLIVSGIVYSNDNPTAVIANRIVHEGDTIFDAVVVKINKNTVELEIDGKKMVQKVQH